MEQSLDIKMGFDLFPNEMNSATESCHPNILRVFRFMALDIIAILIFLWFFNELPWYLCYFTNWGLMTTFIYFVLANLNYFFPILDKTVCVWFLIIWAFNSTISVFFWTCLFPWNEFDNLIRATTTHALPMILSIIEFYLNRIAFVKAQFIFPMATLGGYFGLVLIPVTLEAYQLYPELTFTDLRSYVGVILMLAVGYGSLELGKFIRKRTVKLHHHDHSLEKPLIVRELAYMEKFVEL